MKKVLLALDGSDQSFETVRYVAKIMPPAETEVNLFHVFSKVPEAYWDLESKSGLDMWMTKIKSVEEEHREAVKKVSDKARTLLLDSDFREEHVFVNINERKVGIARDIVAEARNGYAALFMGRVGTANLQGLSMGSVAAKVLGSLTDVNICVVTGAPETQKNLVAFDGSEGAMKAVNFLAELFAGRDRQILLFNAMRHLNYPAFNAAGKNNSLEKLEESLWEEEKGFLIPVMDDAKAILETAGIPAKSVSTKFVTGVSSRAEALIEEAKTSGFGSLFVGRKGITQVSEFHIGRVTNKVVNKANNMAVWVVS